jgi:4-hydroxyphenylpyruvate dioxygenase-like putative hemolysin
MGIDMMKHMRSRLTDLHGMAQQTTAVERQLLEYAQRRLSDVRDDITRLRSRAVTDPSAAEDCQRLIIESGRLENVIANARARGA